MHYCGKCGAQVTDESRFCPKCGAPQMNAPSANPGAAGFQAGAQQGSFQQGGFQNPQQRQAPTNPGQAQQQQQAIVRQTSTSQNDIYGEGPVRTDRSIGVYILLSLVTCGIYGFWFIYQLAKDVNQMCSADGKTTAGLGVYLLLCIVTCGIYSYYWMYQIGDRLQRNAPRYGMQFTESGTTILVWCILAVFTCGIGAYVAMYLIMKNANAMAGRYNQLMGYQYIH